MTSKDTVKRAVSMARTVYRKKPGEVLDFLMLETVIRLMVLSPALFLLTDSLRPWALLTVPLFLLVVPFARERAAENMQDALSGYLEVLYGADPASVGGELPTDNFYFLG